MTRENKGKIAILKIDRAKQRNALSREMFAVLTHELEEIKADANVNAVVITGEGSQAFCAGIDLKERAGKSNEEILREREAYIRPFYTKLANLPKPTFAALNGVVLGGGAELALACDLRIACPEAKFGQTEIRWGMIPSCGACQRLRLLTGMGVAKELIMSGRVIEAEEALRLGIYNRVVPAENLMEETLATAEVIAANPPIAVKNAKRVLDGGADMAMALELEYAASLECFVLGDAMNGAKKF